MIDKKGNKIINQIEKACENCGDKYFARKTTNKSIETAGKSKYCSNGCKKDAQMRRTIGYGQFSSFNRRKK